MHFSQAPKPGPYVKEMQDAAMFYTNRVLKDYKEKYVSAVFITSYTSKIAHWSFLLLFYFAEIKLTWIGSTLMCPFGLSCRPTSSSTTPPD